MTNKFMVRDFDIVGLKIVLTQDTFNLYCQFLPQGKYKAITSEKKCYLQVSHWSNSSNLSII